MSLRFFCAFFPTAEVPRCFLTFIAENAWTENAWKTL